LIARAVDQGKEHEDGLRQAHAWLGEIARRLEPAPASGTRELRRGAQVREQVESFLDEIAEIVNQEVFPAWLRPSVDQFPATLRHFRESLYHCYDVPGLPRTNNDLEQFYRRVKATERRITGHRRSDTFVVRMGGFAVYAIAARALPASALQADLAHVPASDWRAERQTLRTIQTRQTRMRRFRLHRDAYLADLEARWDQIHETGPP
jgi:hypothetical protein